jgi:hypothetical protein
MVVASAILEGRATDEDIAICAGRFRWFDAEAGTCLTYRSEVQICPYLN